MKSRIRSTARISIQLATAIFGMLLASQHAHAVDRFWEGNPGATWSSNVNWTNDTNTLNVGSVVPLAADDVFFHMTGTLGGSGTGMSLNTTAVANSITFRQSQNFAIQSNTSTTTTARSITIGAGGITKTATSGSVTINGNNTNPLTVALATSSSQTWSNASTTTALNIGTTFITGTTAAAVVSLGANTLTLDGAGNFNFGLNGATNNVVTGATGSLIKNGAGTLTINSRTSYGGTTTISGGKLALAGSGTLANTSTIIVGASTTFDVTGLTASSYTLGSSQTVGGSGTILTTGKTVVANGTLSPSSSPGTLTQDGGALQLGVGGDYNWQIHDADEVAGTGYDTTSLINGATLDLSLLSAGNTFNINLWSLSGLGPDVNGNAINFNSALSYSWTLFSTDSLIDGFSTDKFTINTDVFNGTSGFSNDLGGGAFSIGRADGGTDLVLNFTAIPEPEAALLGGLGLLAMLRRRR
jgi:fibronectin-binding autotransporter adhesin